jgi:acyl-CoA thioesterase-1
MTIAARLKYLLLALALTSPAHALATAGVLVFGDSLSAGYGIASDRSWPSLLGRRLVENRLRYTVTNASISGETTAGGRSRLPATLERTRPTVVIIALGANDGLRGLPLAQMRDNLAAMVQAARSRQAKVLLVGMKLPPNYGVDYAEAFERTFTQVARQEQVPLLPFLLAPVALDSDAFQADGLHPTAAAQPRILEHVWTALKPLVR